MFVHWTFVLVPLLVFMSNLDHGMTAAIAGAGLVLALFGCVLLHELGHALMARKYGIGTRDITLYPIGGIARLERMPEKPLAEIAIAVAGPLVNVVIAAGLWFGFQLAGKSFTLDGMYYGSLAHNLLSQLFLANVLLVAFNMLPAFPMDGGRVFRAALAFVFDRLRATEIAVVVSRVIAVFFIAIPVLLRFSPSIVQNEPWLGFFQSPFLIAIGLFLLLSGAQELFVARRMREYQEAAKLAGQTTQAPERYVTVDSQMPAGWSGFTWDPAAGLWIQWRNGQPVSATAGNPPP